jgi:hypothetical protein
VFQGQAGCDALTANRINYYPRAQRVFLEHAGCDCFQG